MRVLAKSIFLLALLTTPRAFAQEPGAGGVCITEEQKEKLRKAILELDAIKNSPAEITVKEPIVIVRDWQDRVYINGGEKKPIQLKLKMGETIERDMSVTLPVMTYYREKPPDPMFRLRIRAQAGFLVPDLFKKDISVPERMDAGLGFDFFHINILNLSVYVGARSTGIGPGVDITRNFGVYSNFSIKYDGFTLGNLTGAYFSF
jgi:hypothetical protein